MCMGGGDSGGGEARSREAAREANIRAGLGRIEKIFQGGKYGTTLASGYDPNATYYTSTGDVWEPDLSQYTTVPNQTNAGNMISKGQAKPEDFAPVVDPQGRRKAYEASMADPAKSLYSAYGTAGGFGDDFYNAREKAYTEYASPQLMDQYKGAHKQLVYSLARTGNINSSEGANQMEALQKTLDTQRRAVADEAVNQKNKLRADVEAQRTNLINQLYATADPQAVSASALNSAASLNSPMSFAPFGEAFSSITDMLSRNREQQTYNNANRQIRSGINPTSSTGSSRIVK